MPSVDEVDGWTTWSHAGEEYTPTEMEMYGNEYYHLRFGDVVWSVKLKSWGNMGQMEPFGRYMCRYVGEGHEYLP